MKLILIGIFKNESHIIKEWVEHYLNFGVDKIFLINNGSTDNFLPEVEKFIKNDKLVIINDSSSGKGNQIRLYNKYFFKYLSLSEWVLVADLDEFIYSRKGFSKITDYLDTLSNNIASVKIPWKMFGSNKHIKQPKSVIAGFTKRLNWESRIGNPIINTKTFSIDHVEIPNSTKIHYKTIVRTKFVLEISVHKPRYNIDNPIIILPNNKVHGEGGTISINKKTNKLFNDSYLHLNHYNIQSLN